MLHRALAKGNSFIREPVPTGVELTNGMSYLQYNTQFEEVIRLGGEETRLISRFKLPSGGEGKSWAHPVVCGGRLYLRHSDQLFAYELRAEP